MEQDELTTRVLVAWTLVNANRQHGIASNLDANGLSGCSIACAVKA
jgi:hypothetical protein